MLKVIQLLSKNLYAMSLYSRQIAGTVVLLFIARYLSVYDYGIFSSYKTICMFCLMFANLGFSDYILVSSNNIVKEVQVKIGIFIIGAITLTSITAIISTFLNLESKIIFILVLLRTFFDNTFLNLMLPYFQSSKKFNIISYVNIFYSLATIIIAIISYFFKLTLVKFLIISIVLGLFNFIQVSFYSKINYLLSIKYYKKLLRKIDNKIFIYITVTLCWYFYNQLPSLYSSSFITKEQAALFFSAFTIANIISLFLSAQVQKMLPELISTTKEKVIKILNNNLKLILAINISILIFFVVFGKYTLKLIYSKPYYMEAYPILLILTIANISISIAAIYGTYITACGKQKLKIKMQFEAIIICIISLIIFYKFGILSASIAYLVSSTHIGIRYYLKTKQLLNKDV